MIINIPNLWVKHSFIKLPASLYLCPWLKGSAAVCLGTVLNQYISLIYYKFYRKIDRASTILNVFWPIARDGQCFSGQQVFYEIECKIEQLRRFTLEYFWNPNSASRTFNVYRCTTMTSQYEWNILQGNENQYRIWCLNILPFHCQPRRCIDSIVYV